MHNVKTTASPGVASATSRLRPRANSTAKPDNMKIDNIDPVGNIIRGPALVVTDAVVPTLMVTVWFVMEVICTEELDRLQVGAKVTAGVIAQFRFTAPLKELVAPNASLKLALCPALMVWEVGEPGAKAMVKSGAACTPSDSGTSFEIEPELAWICIV